MKKTLILIAGIIAINLCSGQNNIKNNSKRPISKRPIMTKEYENTSYKFNGKTINKKEFKSYYINNDLGEELIIFPDKKSLIIITNSNIFTKQYSFRATINVDNNIYRNVPCELEGANVRGGAEYYIKNTSKFNIEVLTLATKFIEIDASGSDIHYYTFGNKKVKPSVTVDASMPNKTYNSEAKFINTMITVNGNTFEMVAVKGGKFKMGCTLDQGEDCEEDNEDDKKLVHQVSLDDYYLGKLEVTQGLWEAVMGSNPSKFKSGANFPVENLSWNDCQFFINKLNSLTGKIFRLPTEAEWEYAARGGNKVSRQTKYAGSNDGDVVAWWDANGGAETHAVGTKKPNALGLYDMSGNVWEWCSDWYKVYSSKSVTNPKGPISGSHRVQRGGGWASVSFRGMNNPDFAMDTHGFRLAYSSSK